MNTRWSLFGTGECICSKFLELLEINGSPSVLGHCPKVPAELTQSYVVPGSSSAQLF